MGDQLDKYIEDYLSGRLSEPEEAALEARLETDAEFKELYESHQIANTLIEIDYAKSLSGLIHKEKASIKRKKYAKLGGAGLILVAVLVGSYWSITTEKEVIVKAEEQVVYTIDREIEQNLTVDDEPISNPVSTNTEEANPVEKPEQKLVDTKEANLLEVVIDEVNEVSPKDSGISEAPKTGKPILPQETKDTELKEAPQETKEIKEKGCSFLRALKVDVTHADLGEINGSIRIEETKGVTYKIRNFSAFEETNYFIDLEPGIYEVSMASENECLHEFGDVVVKEKPCLKKKSMVFNPEYDSELVIKLSENETTSISIFDEKGSLVFQEELYSESEFKWSGRTSDGDFANLGSYIVRVNGGENENCEYFVVVSK